MTLLKKNYLILCCFYVFGLLSLFLLERFIPFARHSFTTATKYYYRIKPKTYKIQTRKDLTRDKINIVLISIDALRYDRFNEELSPYLWNFASEGQIFKNAYTVFPGTPPSFASLMTSKLPHFKGLRLAKNNEIFLFGLTRFYSADEDMIGLPQSIDTMSEIFRKNGYITMGVISNPFLRSEFNFDRGFDVYETFRKIYYSPYPKARDVISRATSMLENVGDKIFFLWMHFMDVHYPYQSSEEARKAIANVKMRHIHHDIDHHLLNRIVPSRLRPLRFNDEWQTDFIESKNLEYNSAIYLLDRKIGKFIENIKRLNLYENTIFIILADHGEEFSDHGYFGHKQTLYEELVRIPLIIHCPKLFDPKEHHAFVRNLDILPTLTDLLNLKGPRNEIDGISLKPLLMGDLEDLNIKVYMTAVFKKGIIDGEWKLIRNDRNNISTRFELYNLIEDPFEYNNNYCKNPKKAKELLQIMNNIEFALDQETLDHSISIQSKKNVTIKGDIKKQLRTLGYIQ